MVVVIGFPQTKFSENLFLNFYDLVEVSIYTHHKLRFQMANIANFHLHTGNKNSQNYFILIWLFKIGMIIVVIWEFA